MSTQLITEKVWQTITGVAKKTRFKSFVAVAYFGQGGARMLPLSKGSLLLVDASEKAVKSGQTCPAELLKLYNKGVHIYSLPNLHAKMFVLGNSLYIGSTNVSSYSKSILKEALIKSTDKKSLDKAKEYIKSFCKIELGDEQLRRLQKKYNPPKIFLGKKVFNLKAKKIDNNLPALYTYNLELNEWSDDDMIQYEKGYTVAIKKRKIKSRHILDQFVWYNSFPAHEGDIIVQIVDEGDMTYVSPPGTVIHSRKWSNGNKVKFFCYLEIPDKKRKNIKWIKKKLNVAERNELKRNGKRSRSFAEKMYSLWPVMN